MRHNPLIIIFSFLFIFSFSISIFSNQKKQFERQEGVAKIIKNQNEKNLKAIDQSDQTVSLDDSYSWWLAKVIVFFFIFIFGAFSFFKYFNKKAVANFLGKGEGQILFNLPLGPGKFIKIVEVTGKVLILGITDHNINLLTEIVDKVEIEEIRKRSLSQKNFRGKKAVSFYESFLINLKKRLKFNSLKN